MAPRRATGSGREIELKLLARPEVLARLRRSPLLGRFAVGRTITRSLHSVYYDTPDLALRDKGLALRVRTMGSGHIQTVKTEEISGAASNRSEAEAPLPDARPDPARITDKTLRRSVTTAAVTGLRPVYETDIRRTERRLVTPEGDRLELAFDTGVIRAAGREEPVSELELELKSGNVAALYRLARPVVEKFDVQLGVLSKAARGYALATGESGIVPVKAAPPVLNASMTAEEAAQAVLQACLAQIVGNEPAIVTARDPEGVHQMRVALRRLRSGTSLFAQTGLEAWLDPLAAEAHWFASRLGRTRDLDVFMDEMLLAVEAGFPGHAGLARLRMAAQERRGTAWNEARIEVASSRFTGFVLSMAAVAEERPWRRPGTAGEARAAPALPVRDLARRVLQDRLERVKAGAQDLDRLTAEQRHALRIEVKKLRYTADFFSGLYPREAVKPFLKLLSKLQDIFGDVNDAAVARRLARKLAKRAEGGQTGMLREAAGLVAGWHGHRAAQQWKKAGERWQAFETITPFWRV